MVEITKQKIMELIFGEGLRIQDDCSTHRSLWTAALGVDKGGGKRTSGGKLHQTGTRDKFRKIEAGSDLLWNKGLRFKASWPSIGQKNSRSDEIKRQNGKNRSPRKNVFLFAIRIEPGGSAQGKRICVGKKKTECQDSICRNWPRVPATGGVAALERVCQGPSAKYQTGGGGRTLRTIGRGKNLFMPSTAERERSSWGKAKSIRSY